MVNLYELKNVKGKKMKIFTTEKDFKTIVCDSIIYEDDEEPLLLYNERYAIPQSQIKSIEILD